MSKVGQASYQVSGSHRRDQQFLTLLFVSQGPVRYNHILDWLSEHSDTTLDRGDSMATAPKQLQG